jgi:hypothetical protein
MQRLRLWSAILVFAPALMGFGARGALQLPTFVVGTNVYSNAVINSASGGRVLVEYARGMASIKIADLDLDTQQQLAAAGLVKPEMAKQIEKEIAKREAAKKKAESPVPATPGLTVENAEKSSIADLLTGLMVRQARDKDVEFNLEWLLGRFGRVLVGAITLALVLAGIFRRVLFFRVCKNSTGVGSFLVFIPVLRWLALTQAAGLSKQWLLLPSFAIVALFLPPPFVQKYPWAAVAYLILLAFLWFSTLVLYVIWCVRLCLAVGRSAAWALLLLFPVLDYITLVVLAFSEAKHDTSRMVGTSEPLAI